MENEKETGRVRGRERMEREEEGGDMAGSAEDKAG